MTKRARKAPKRKTSATHKKRARKHHARKPADTFNTAPEMQTRIITDDEKHELIRAHAETRQSHKSLGVGYYTAIVTCCLVVAGGWLMTLQENFGLKVATTPDPAVQTVKEGFASFKNTAAIRFPEVKKDFEETKEKLGNKEQVANGLVHGAATGTQE